MRHDMTFAVKVALNPNTTNQPIIKLVLYRNIFKVICCFVKVMNLVSLDEEKFLILYQTIPTFNDCEKRLLKTLWEKEKMLALSIFSFSNIVFHLSQNKFLFLQSHLFCCQQMHSVWTSLKICCLEKG